MNLYLKYLHEKRNTSIFRDMLILLFLTLSLAACTQDDTSAMSYVAYNHTDKSIVSIAVNGEGGVLHAPAHDGGGEVCCVELPRKWRPGLKATIKWEEDGDWLKDEKGNVVIRDGKEVYVPVPWKERTVEVPKYDEKLGQFFIHFMPNDEVKVAVTLYGAGHPKHPYHFSDVQ